MKIKQKIILSNIFNVTLVVLIGMTAFQGLNNVLTKLKFVEIADDLNASFLEMRLAEKNYFLYNDSNALDEIREKIKHSNRTLEMATTDIERAIGKHKLQILRAFLDRYTFVVDQVIHTDHPGENMAADLREAGRKLREFSSRITKLERSSVSVLVIRSKTVVIVFFWIITISAAVVSRIAVGKVLQYLENIEDITASISEGNFNEIEVVQGDDELGSVIRAINSMSHELRNREEELIQSKKLTSIGILTAGVAHELTNPLNNISMIAQTYEEVYDNLGKEERISFMRKIDSETERIRAIVGNLLDFSKPKKTTRAAADVNHVVFSSLHLVQNSLDIANVDTQLNLAEGLPRVLIDERQIQQVFINLAVNAIQAMTDTKKILTVSTNMSSNPDFVEIRVNDTGRGIPREYLHHIFDPFFSTKKEDSGTGLGLSVSYGIIKNLKGNIRVESEVGVGTTFTVELPVFKEMEIEDDTI